MRASHAPSQRARAGASSGAAPAARTVHLPLSARRASNSILLSQRGARSGSSSMAASNSVTDSERQEDDDEDADEADEEQEAAQEQAEEAFAASQRDGRRTHSHTSSATSSDNEDEDEEDEEEDGAASNRRQPPQAEEDDSDADDEDEPLVQTPQKPETSARSAARKTVPVATSAQRAARASRRSAGVPASRSGSSASEDEEDGDVQMQDVNAGGAAAAADAEERPIVPVTPSKKSSQSPAKAKATASAASHSKAAADSPARAVRASASSERKDAMDDGDGVEPGAPPAEQADEEEVLAVDTSDSDVPVAELSKKRKKKEKKKERKRRRQADAEAAAAEVDIDVPEEHVSPSVSAPSSPMQRSPTMHAAHQRSPILQSEQFELPTMSQLEEDDGGAAGGGGARVISQLLASSDIGEQELALQKFKDIFHEASNAASQASSTSVKEARVERDRLTKQRRSAASALIDAVHRGNLQDRVAGEALRVLRSHLHLLPVTECALLIFLKLQDAQLWFRTADGNAAVATLGQQCRPTLNFTLFPVLLQRCTQAGTIRASWLPAGERVADVFVEDVVNLLVAHPLRPDLIDGLLEMVQDLNLTKNQLNVITAHIVEDLPNVPLSEFGSVCYRLWLSADESNRGQVLVGVLERMTMLEKEVLDALNTAQKHAVHPHISLTQQQGHNALAGNSELQSAVQNMRQFRQMLVMLLLQWETALKSDAKLGTTLLEQLKKGEVELTTFSLGLVLDLLRQSSQFASTALALLVDTYARWFGRQLPGNGGGATSAWLATVRRQGAKTPSNPSVPMDQLLVALKAEKLHPTLLQAIIRLAFTLLDRALVSSAAQHDLPSHRIVVDLAGPDAPESTRSVTECCVASGAALLNTLFNQHADTQRDIVKELLARIDRNAVAGMVGVASIKVLKKLIDNRQSFQHISKFGQEIMSSLEWLHCQTPQVGMQLLTALLPLLRSKKDLRDFAIRTVHKLLSQPQTDARLLAVDAFFLFIESPFDYGAGRLHRAASAIESSQPQPSQHHGSNRSDIDMEFFHDSALSMFRRALSQPQADVRARVYRGLLRLFRNHAELRSSILDLLQMHLSHYQHDSVQREALHAIGARAPLQLDRALDASRTRAVEPLPLLYSTVHSMLLNPELSELPQPDNGAHEFTSAQLAQIDSGERSAALLQLHMQVLLDNLLGAKSLKDLGIVEGHLAAATMEDPAGVAGVLQAQLMHGLLCSFFEYVLMRETQMQQATGSNASVTSGGGSVAQSVLSVRGCQQLLHLFSLIHELHTLLTTAPKAEKKPSSGSSSSSKKKKKKKADEDDDEEDEDEEDEEDEEEHDEEDDEDEEAGPRSAAGRAKPASKKKKKKAAAAAVAKRKRAAGPKPPPKAVVALSRGGRWKQYALSWPSVLQLLYLSQPHTGQLLNPRGSRHSQARVDPLADQMHERVGDALCNEDLLQRWVCSNFIRLVEAWAEIDDCSDIAVRLQDVAPLLLQKVSSALELIKQVVPESEDKKKGARRTESLMLLLQRLLLLVFRVLVTSSTKQATEPLTMFLYHLLPLDSRGKVQESNEQGVQSISFSKLINWFYGKLELWCKDCIASKQWSEAAACLDVLLYLISFLPLVALKHQAVIRSKRVTWAEEQCTSEVKDAHTAVLLLDYTFRVQESTEQEQANDRDGSIQRQHALLMQVAACVRKLHTGEAPEVQAFVPMDIGGEDNVAKLASWCVHHIRVALDEVDSVLSEIRDHVKRPASSGRRQMRGHVCQRLCDLIDLIDMLLMSQCQGKAANDLHMIVQRFYKTLTKLARVEMLSLPPTSDYMRLSELVHDVLQPSLMEQQQFSEETFAQRVRDADSKEKKENLLKLDAARTTKMRKCQEIYTVAQLALAKKIKKSKGSHERGDRLLGLMTDSAQQQPLSEIRERGTPGSAQIVKREPLSPLKRTPVPAAVASPAATAKRRTLLQASPAAKARAHPNEQRLPRGSGASNSHAIVSASNGQQYDEDEDEPIEDPGEVVKEEDIED